MIHVKISIICSPLWLIKAASVLKKAISQFPRKPYNNVLYLKILPWQQALCYIFFTCPCSRWSSPKETILEPVSVSAVVSFYSKCKSKCINITLNILKMSISYCALYVANKDLTTRLICCDVWAVVEYFKRNLVLYFNRRSQVLNLI